MTTQYWCCERHSHLKNTLLVNFYGSRKSGCIPFYILSSFCFRGFCFDSISLRILQVTRFYLLLIKIDSFNITLMSMELPGKRNTTRSCFELIMWINIINIHPSDLSLFSCFLFWFFAWMQCLQVRIFKDVN